MKTKLLTGAAVFLLGSSAAFAGNAVTTPADSIINVLGQFTDTFHWTTTVDYRANSGSVFVLANKGTNFSNLKITLSTLTNSATFDAVAGADGSSKATFSDKNVSFDLAANTTYTVVVSGYANVANSALTLLGTNFKNVTPGVVTAVPEPESYAMLLAGLGLMGTIARRRSKASQA